MKTLFRILIILIVLGLIGYGAYWFFSQKESGVQNPFKDGMNVGDFFPFGTGGNNTNTSPTGNTSTTSNVIPNNPTTPPKLWQISSEPQSGAVVFNASGTPTVRFVDKTTGNIFESKLTLTGSKRISNTTVPKVYDALWQKNGTMLALQYLGSDEKTIKTLTGKLSGTTSKSPEGENLEGLKTSFLPDNIQSLSVEPNTGTLVYLMNSPSGSRVLVSTATSPKQIFDSAIKDFAVSWVNKATIALMSKPSALARGQLYFLKADNGLLTRVMSGPVGLSTASNQTGTQILYSESSGSAFNTNILDVKTGNVSQLTLQTLAEKCVWSEKNPYVYCAVPKSVTEARYPDDWYQGKINFEDNIWQINTLTGTTKLLIDSNQQKASFDAINLSLDPEEKYIVFTNKTDSELWGLKI